MVYLIKFKVCVFVSFINLIYDLNLIMGIWH